MLQCKERATSEREPGKAWREMWATSIIRSSLG